MRFKSMLLCAAACGTVVTVSPVFAQEAEQRDMATERPSDPGEIIVTARKRQESILRVPVVANVISQAEIERVQLSNLTNISSRTPGLILGLSALEVGTQVSIRGIGTTAIDPGIDQSISLNLDGLQVSQGSAYSVGVFDMAQVEVLKGPQALFFGKNSPGGVISIRTADPSDELEVIGRIGYEFEAREVRGEAILSTPLTDTLGLRVAAMYSDFGGFFRNTATPLASAGAIAQPSRFGQSTTLFLRGTLLFKPVSHFSARLKVNYTRDRQDGGAPFQLKSCPEGTAAYAGVPFFGVSEDCRVDRNLNHVGMDPAAFGGLRNGGLPFTNITQKFGSLELNYDTDSNISLTSLTGYFNLVTDALFNGTNAGYAAPAIAADKHLRRKEFTQELRVNTDFSGPLNFTAGGFYQDANVTNDIDVAGNTRYQLPSRFAIGSHHMAIKSYSLFGQIRYKPAEVFEIAVGTRWTSEQRRDRPETVDLFGAYGGAGGSVVRPNVPRLSTKNWSPEFTLTYTPTDDLTIFGSLKQGYKSGSYNLIVPVNPGEDNSFGDEKIQGGELGIKTRVLDRSLALNLAVYYYKYQGLQVGANEAAAGGLPVIRTVNAGSAKIYGVDFDLRYVPSSIPGLTVTGAANWNHARFSSFPGAPCLGGQTISAGCDQFLNPTTGLYQGQDLTGAALVRAPSWQLTLGANYEFPASDRVTLSMGVDGQYSSSYVAGLGLRDDLIQPAFAKLNANFAVKDSNEAWEFALIGNNLTNRFTSGFCGNLNYAGGQVFPGSISGGATTGPAGQDEIHCTFDRGREVWLRMTLRPSKIFSR